ncbi:hypothetical protein [Agrobacterium larrymoorei]|uniref:Uncharacterized protein n=1 Tax=Agrobacterium larrymoorei TaxID=160699 RepID=A0ABU0UDZ0_9HYPH|nr:hypothetical protein [Agrobacterium larrymoorei]MDQ1183160.1 hypothetical protein [Agrobacterium larrymoorei]
MTTKAQQKTQIEILTNSAANIASLSVVLDGHLNSVTLTTKEIIAAAVALMKSVLGDETAMAWFLALAKARNITIPDGFDPSMPLNNGNNPWLYICRVLVGSTDNLGRWVPSMYVQKNLPGVMRWLSKNSVEMDAEGLKTALESASFKVGKKVLKGLEAAKYMDRSVNGTPRKVSTPVRYQVPREVDKLKAVAEFEADKRLFPVDKDGYGIATVRHLGGNKFGIYFGNERDQDVAEIIERSFEFHKKTLEKSPARTVDLTKTKVVSSTTA